MHPSPYTGSTCVSTHNPWYHCPSALALFPMYSQDHEDYPSPAPSDPSHLSHQQQNQSSFDQIDSSIGPSRVSRRQASLKQCLPVRRVSLSTNYMEDASVRPCPPYFINSYSLTRLGSITGYHRAAL